MSDKNSSVDWASLEAKPEFRELLKRKKRFITTACIFFVAYYFALPVMVGWFPAFMKKPVLGHVNIAYLFALSEFFMAWTLAFIYTRKAAQWDIAAASIIKVS